MKLGGTINKYLRIYQKQRHFSGLLFDKLLAHITWWISQRLKKSLRPMLFRSESMQLRPGTKGSRMKFSIRYLPLRCSTDSLVCGELWPLPSIMIFKWVFKCRPSNFFRPKQDPCRGSNCLTSELTTSIISRHFCIPGLHCSLRTDHYWEYVHICKSELQDSGRCWDHGK